jgi:hypothetical protein
MQQRELVERRGNLDATSGVMIDLASEIVIVRLYATASAQRE